MSARNSHSRNGSILFIGQLVRIGTQGLYFLLLARALGVDDLGIWSAIIAIGSLVAPFSSLGLGIVLARDVSRDRTSYPTAWRKALQGTLTSGTVLSVSLACIIKIASFHALSYWCVLLLLISDLVFSRIIDVAAYVSQAFDHYWNTALFLLQASALRCLALAVVVLLGGQSFQSLALVYFGTSVVSTIVCVVVTTLRYGAPARRVQITFRERLEGLSFAVAIVAQTANNDVDKFMLASINGGAAAGFYSVGYRVIDMSFVPARSLLGAIFVPFFKHGAESLGAAIRFARSVAGKVLLLAISASIGLLLTSPLVRFIFGEQYRQAGTVVAALCALPTLKAIHTLAADILTGAGFQLIRTLIQIGGAAVNVAANLIILPTYSWRGAIWTSIGSDLFLVLGMCSLVWIYSRRRQDQLPATSGTEESPKEDASVTPSGQSL